MIGGLVSNTTPGLSPGVYMPDAMNISVDAYFRVHPDQYIASWGTEWQLIGLFTLAGFGLGIFAGYKFAAALERYRARHEKPKPKE